MHLCFCNLYGWLKEEILHHKPSIVCSRIRTHLLSQSHTELRQKAKVCKQDREVDIMLSDSGILLCDINHQIDRTHQSNAVYDFAAKIKMKFTLLLSLFAYVRWMTRCCHDQQ